MMRFTYFGVLFACLLLVGAAMRGWTSETEETAREIRPFGYAFFAETHATTGAPVTAVPADYRLGPHDKLRLRYWTPSLPETAVEEFIKENGAITVPGIGELKAAGLTLEAFSKRFDSLLKEQLKQPACAADLLEVRTITVFVTGAARHPGAYALKATAGLFDAVLAANGAADEGSLRHIALLRDGKPVTEQDTYRFLLTGANAQFVPLQDRDTVFFPLTAARVAVAGEVARPAIYEYLTGQHVADALALAGGLKAAAYPGLLHLQRVENGQRVERTLDARALLANAKHADNMPLQDGDVLAVERVPARIRERVIVHGPAEFTGDFALARTPTVKALLVAAKLKPGAYRERADVLRLLPDGTPVVIPVPVKLLLDGKAEDVPLQDQDELVVYDFGEKAPLPLVAVEGPVKHPASYRLTEGMRLNDLLFTSGGLLRDATREVAHIYRHGEDGKLKILRVTPAKAGASDPALNVPLQDGDRLVIYPRTEVEAVPGKVSVVGEVRRPGDYTLYQGMTLYDLLLIAGGPTEHAAAMVEVARPLNDPTGKRGSEVKTLPLTEVLIGTHRDDPLAAGMLIAVPRGQDSMARTMTVELKGELKRPGFYTLLYEGEPLGSLIERAGGLTAEGEPFGIALMRTKDKLLSGATQEQINTVLKAMDKMLPPLAGAAAAGTGATTAAAPAGSSTEVLDAPVPSLNPLSPSDRSEKILLVSPRRLTDMAANTRIGFKLEKRDTFYARMKQVPLADGDTIEVPRASHVVQILGAVQSPGPVDFEANLAARQYLDRAGGTAPDADLKRAVVIKLSGAVQPLDRTKAIDAGDVIVVASKYQIIQPPMQQHWGTTLVDLFGMALVVRGLK